MSTPEADQQPKPVLQRLMIPLSSGLLVLIAGFIFAQTILHKQQLSIATQQLVDNTLISFNLRIESESKLLTALQQLVLSESDITTALKFQNRHELLTQLKPQYEKLLKTQNITHFYFHNADGTNLVRFHQPETYGDVIDRFTLKQARETGVTSSGIELGQIGTYTLRVVTPIFNEDTLIGFIELGKELEVLLEHFQTLDNVEVALLIHKETLQGSHRVKNFDVTQSRYDWDRYDHAVLTYASDDEIANVLDRFLISDSHAHDHEHSHDLPMQHDHKVSAMYKTVYKNNPSLLSFIPLADAAGHKNTDLVLLNNISQPTHTFYQWIGITLLGSLITFVLVSSFLYLFLKKVDAFIARQHKELVKSHDMLDKTLSVANDGTWEWFLDSGQVSVNDPYFTMAGYQPHEFQPSYQTWRERVHPDDLDKCEAAVRNYLENKSAKFDIEFRFKRKDGSYMWIRARGKIFSYDEKGQPQRFIGTHVDITERKLAQQALVKSEQQYRLLVENQTDLIVEVDKDGHFLFVSPSYCKLFGKTQDELLGKTFMPLVHEEDVENTMREMEKLHHPPHSCYLEQRAMTAEGWRCLGWMDTAVLDDQGNIKSILGVGRDITERKKIEQQLKDSEERFSKAFYSQPTAMEIVDLEKGIRLEFNDAYCDITGYSRSELLNTSFYKKNLWIHPEGQEQVVRDLKSNGYIHAKPMDIRNKSGTIKNLLMTAAMLEIKNESLVIASMIDITHIKAAEQALRESEFRYRTVFNQQYQFMATLAPDGTTLEINDMPLKTTGFKREEFVGKPFWLTPFWVNLPEWQEIWQQRLHEAGRLKSPIHTQDIYQTADGSIRSAETTTTAIVNNKGEVIMYLMQASDNTDRLITERQRDELFDEVQQLNVNLELRVKQRTAELNTVNKELEAFSYSVSHDLRAPLRAIDGFSLALVEDYGEKLDATAHDYLQRVRNSAQRMGHLIDDLLQLSRVNRDKLSLQTVDLATIAQEVIQELGDIEPDRNIKIILGEDLITEGDVQLCRVVLDNLLGNAWKFTSKKDKAHIRFDKMPQNTSIFYVQDNGAGFNMQHAKNLFGAFQRLHRTTDFPGTGIGLATVQRIIHRHGGEIWAEANEGKGATFYFTLKPKNHGINTLKQTGKQ